MRRTNLWPVSGVVLGASALMVLGGSAGGGELGRLVGGYGLLLMLAGLYLVGALALRERHSRRQMRRGPSVASPTELHVRRIF